MLENSAIIIDTSKADYAAAKANKVRRQYKVLRSKGPIINPLRKSRVELMDKLGVSGKRFRALLKRERASDRVKSVDNCDGCEYKGRNEYAIMCTECPRITKR